MALMCLKTLCDHWEPVASIFVFVVIGKYALFIQTPRDLLLLYKKCLDINTT